MTGERADTVFAGSVPELYEKFLVPLIFESYAADLAARVAARPVTRILEVAAGTGVVTRAMAKAVPETASITATDLNQAMLDIAIAQSVERAVTWRQADVMALPFEDAAFDAVVCQFGVMFFPDKGRAHAEVRRVLRPGGVYIFNVWDRIEENEFADVITQEMERIFPSDPPRFLPRTPYGYFDFEAIKRDLTDGGFRASPMIHTLTARSRAASPQHPSIAYCQGTPLRGEIEARNASGLREATEAATEAIAQRFGRGPVDGKIQGHIVTVTA